MSPLIMAGKALAEEKCQTCHAVGIKGDSENLMAPPLRVLAQNYPIEDLSEAFAEGILIGHSEMPEFRFEPAQLDALLAYIESIQEPAAKPGNAPKAG
jgi:cytochrome c